MLLPESDNESTPSPVKSQPKKVPYCKTYEQMRLEEIQAESAAYYSYDDGESYGGFQRSQSDVGKAKNSRGNRWIFVNPCKDKQETPTAKKLDFEVLSLEEIRRRKKEKEGLAAGAAIMDTSEPSSPIETKSAKRRSTEPCGVESDGSPPKKRRISTELTKSNESTTTTITAVKVAPVKLRRSLRSTVASGASETETTRPTCRDVVNERGTAEEDGQTPCRERLETDINNSASVSRRGDVEVRLCDSSTKEERTQTQSERGTEDKKSVATYTTEDINVLFDAQSYATTGEEYLRLDASSDDIMRDIEALLK